MGLVGTPLKKLLEPEESMPDDARGIVGNVVLSEERTLRRSVSKAEVLAEGLLHLRKEGTKLQKVMGEDLWSTVVKGFDLCSPDLTESLVFSLRYNLPLKISTTESMNFI